jgi:thiosulfate/3-mercaptopyruvate sulfurtransferase
MNALIEPEELARRLSATGGREADVAVVDCRFDLARPQWGEAAHAAGHVPNAVYAHLDRDLSGTLTPETGRHPLPGRQTLVDTLSRWGIDAKVQVVAYDQGNGAYAARLWWLLRWVGHQDVAVLNGGFAAWQQAGLPVETTHAARQPRQFVPHHPVGTAREAPGGQDTDDTVVSTAEVERLIAGGALARGDSMLFDARAADRFAGENETIDPVAGHVPGARNHPFARNLDASGRFLPADELRRRWQDSLRGRSPAQAIMMCGSGVTACHNLLALQIAGLGGARLYAGSWSEWIRDPAHAVGRGPDTSG